MQFITEQFDTTKVVTQLDEESGKKTMFIEGIFLQDTVKNRNGRSYPKSVMKEAVDEYTQNYINTKRAMGELNHPPTPQVNPERAAILIQSIKESGTDWFGKAKVLNTPMGNIIRNLIEDGVQMGISSRGLGAVKESQGVSVVQHGYLIKAHDVVSDPSAPAAFVNGIMENKEWIFENGILVEREIEQAQEFVDKAVSQGNFNDEFLRDFFKKAITSI